MLHRNVPITSNWATIIEQMLSISEEEHFANIVLSNARLERRYIINGVNDLRPVYRKPCHIGRLPFLIKHSKTLMPKRVSAMQPSSACMPILDN